MNVHESGDRDEYLVHRLEAFSDIVIGFSLAELTLSLAVPAHPRDLWQNPVWLIAYAWTFSVVSWIWFSHYRLFRFFFVPTRLDVFLNYLLLATVGLLVFTTQVFAHAEVANIVSSQSIADMLDANRLYFFVLAVNFAIRSVLLWRGAFARRSHVGEAMFARTVRVAIGNAAAAVFLTLGVTFGGGLGIWQPSLLGLSIFAGFAFGRLASGLIAKRA